MPAIKVEATHSSKSANFGLGPGQSLDDFEDHIEFAVEEVRRQQLDLTILIWSSRPTPQTRRLQAKLKRLSAHLTVSLEEFYKGVFQNRRALRGKRRVGIVYDFEPIPQMDEVVSLLVFNWLGARPVWQATTKFDQHKKIGKNTQGRIALKVLYDSKSATPLNLSKTKSTKATSAGSLAMETSLVPPSGGDEMTSEEATVVSTFEMLASKHPQLVLSFLEAFYERAKNPASAESNGLKRGISFLLAGLLRRSVDENRIQQLFEKASGLSQVSARDNIKLKDLIREIREAIPYVRSTGASSAFGHFLNHAAEAGVAPVLFLGAVLDDYVAERDIFPD